MYNLFKIIFQICKSILSLFFYSSYKKKKYEKGKEFERKPCNKNKIKHQAKFVMLREDSDLHNMNQEKKPFSCRPTVAYRGCSRRSDKETRVIRELDSENAIFLRAEHGNFGDDAFFIVQSDNYLVLGIADGVGGLSKRGIDPSKFSGSLVKHGCKNSVKIIQAINQNRDSNCKEYNISAIDILRSAYNDLIRYDVDEAIGSSTACFGSYNFKTKVLQVANLGDSAAYVRKSSKFEFMSEPMLHSFNFPFQLTNPPEKIRKSHKKLSKPQDAIVYDIRLFEGDYFIIGSDGVWDNIDIKNTKTNMDCENYKVEQSNNMLEEKQNMVNRFADNFFGEVFDCSRWKKHRYRILNKNVKLDQLQKEHWYGGKTDDISFVMVLV